MSRTRTLVWTSRMEAPFTRQMLITVPRQGMRMRCGARTTRATASRAEQSPWTISRASAATTTGVENDVPLHVAHAANSSGSTLFMAAAEAAHNAEHALTSATPGAHP